MSVLTDLFTSIANSIRSHISNTGNIRAVDFPDYVDQVYDKGKTDVVSESGNATANQVLYGATFTSSNAGTRATGTMPNRGTSEVYLHTMNENGASNSFEIRQGWHNNGFVTADVMPKTVTAGTSAIVVRGDKISGGGEYDRSFLGKVTVNPTPSYSGSARATTSDQQINPTSGNYFSSFIVYPQQHSGTYSATSRSASLDMGSIHNQRYVNTNSVPNTNSATYTYGQTNGGTVDLGATNTYRYVNAENVRKWVCVNMTSATASTTTNVRSVYIDTSGATGIYIIIASSPDKTLKSIYINTTNAHRYYDQMLINGNSTSGAYVGAACFGVNGSAESHVNVYTDVTCAVIKVYKLTC